MDDTETGVAQDGWVEEFIDAFGTEVPPYGVEFSSSETVTIELSKANANRLANGMAVAAHHILQEEPDRGVGATRQVLGLREEIKRQIRDQEYGEDEE